MLNTLAAVVPGRTHMPTLRCVLISANDGKLTLIATNLTSAVRFVSNQVQVESEGDLLVDCLRLRAIAGELPDETLLISVEGSVARVRGACADFRLVTGDPSQFPPLPNAEPVATATLPAAALRRMLNQTIFATAKETTRYDAFSGVLFRCSAKRLELVASDGHRLSACEAKASGKGKADAIVPADACRQLGKILDDPESDATVALSENAAQISCGDATLYANLVEGSFPPYEQIIPGEFPRRATVGREEFASAVRQAALVATDELGTGIKLSLDGRGIRFSGRTPEAGEAEISLPCKFTGEDMEIGFEASPLSEAVRAGDAEEITLDLTGPATGVMFNLGAGFRYFAMPRKLSQ
jgi:DNA polymerase-3 subunit beta